MKEGRETEEKAKQKGKGGAMGMEEQEGTEKKKGEAAEERRKGSRGEKREGGRKEERRGRKGHR